ncbi:MAG TPA: VapE domain-containing protein [Coleofasciculaceae cyanobacterium]|jgi:predicted P-loop ATPase
MKLHRAVSVELSELGNAFRKADQDALKTFITTSSDDIRLPYGTRVHTLKRQFVLFGSTNDRQFLHDPTGSRRFMPVEIEQGWQIPVEKHLECFDDLIQAAMILRESGAKHYLEEADVVQLAEHNERNRSLPPPKKNCRCSQNKSEKDEMLYAINHG